MIKEVDNCVGCTSMGMPCIGLACPNRKREIFCCDNCESEESLYRFDGGVYCIRCIIETLEAVGNDEEYEGYEDD